MTKTHGYSSVFSLCFSVLILRYMGVALWAQAIRSYCTGLSRWPVSAAIPNANTWVFMGIFR